MPRRTYRKCSIETCQNNVVAKDLCDLHYRRLLHHGDVEQGRPTDWGKRDLHPLYNHWTWIRRSNKRIDSRWDDFWTFVKDVGDRPSSIHRIGRVDESRPYGPDNFLWREKKFLQRRNETKKDYQRRYMQNYRQTSPDKVRDAELRKRYGIGVEKYDAMVSEQNGLCAICMRAETSTNPRTGKPRALAVDHCHRSGHVRKLLCQNCNQGLGN